MKKLVVLILALCMLCSVASAADLNWADAEEAASKIAGEFKTFDEISVKIWIPDVLKAVDAGENRIGYFMTEDESAAISVQYVDMNGMSLEEYEAALKDDADVSELEFGTVNGLPALSYMLKENDTACIAFTTEMGYILEVVVGPATDENSRLGASVILASIQAAE